jgi:hypothetical protein
VPLVEEVVAADDGAVVDVHVAVVVFAVPVAVTVASMVLLLPRSVVQSMQLTVLDS